MKIGTAPKITIGVAALIAVIFIGYIGIRQLNAPTVAERVYLSPWEDGAARPQNSPEGLAAQTNPTQDTESGDNQPQIASAASAEERELIDDLFAELDETDLAQFATETEFNPDAEESFAVDTSVSLESTSQSAEDVMYAYVEAVKNVDADVMRSLVTGTVKERFEESVPGEAHPKIEIGRVRNETEKPDEVVEAMAEETTRQLEQQLFDPVRKMYSQTEVVSSEYVGDEFHFQLKMPALEIPEMPDVELHFHHHQPQRTPSLRCERRMARGEFMNIAMQTNTHPYPSLSKYCVRRMVLSIRLFLLPALESLQINRVKTLWTSQIQMFRTRRTSN